MYLLLSLVWLVVAVAFFVWVDHGRARGYLPIPPSGVALFFALFTLLKWWTTRNRRPAEVTMRDRPPRRPGDDREPDPAFRFTDQPAEQPPNAEGGIREPGPK